MGNNVNYHLDAFYCRSYSYLLCDLQQVYLSSESNQSISFRSKPQYFEFKTIDQNKNCNRTQ